MCKFNESDLLTCFAMIMVMKKLEVKEALKFYSDRVI